MAYAPARLITEDEVGRW